MNTRFVSSAQYHIWQRLKIIAILLCMFFFCFLFGCGKTSEGENNINQPEEPQEDMNMPDNTGEQNSSEEDPVIDKDGKDTDTDSDTNPEIDIEFEILENYKERNIPSVYEQSNEKEHYSNVCLDNDNHIVYYTYSEDEAGYHIWKYTLVEDTAANTASWEREAVLWTEGIAKEIAYGQVKVLAGQDGKEYVWYLGVDEKAHFAKQNEESFLEITGLNWIYSEHIEPAVLANGNIVLANLERNCSIYNPEDGSMLEQFPCGFYQSLCVKGNQIYIGDKTGSSVQHYDAEKGEFAATMESGFKTTIRVAASGEDIYVCTQGGIYRAKQTGGEFKKVLDSGTYHFAKEGGNLLKFFVIGDAFYILYGEDGGTIKKYSPAGENDVVEKILNIYSLESNDTILDMISEFQNKYPDTEIIYEAGEGGEGSITVADRIRALNTRILAGDGPDVLVLDGLPTEAYIEKGILADLNPVLEEREGELLPSVLSAYTVDEKIYMLPLRISFPMFFSAERESALYSSLEALAEYSEAEDGVFPQYSYEEYLEILYYNYPPNFLSEDKAVNKEKLSEFLKLVKRLCESEDALEEQWINATYWEGRDSSVFLARGEADCAFVLMSDGYTALGAYPHVIEIRNGEMIPKGDVFFPMTLLGINCLSGKEELAKIFIEFAFSYEIQDRFVGKRVGYPIDLKVLDKFAQLDRSMVTYSSGDTVLRGTTQKENEQMIQFIKEGLHTPFTVDASIWEIIEEEAMGYLKGEKKLEDCVDAIASRIQLYLYEQ